MTAASTVIIFNQTSTFYNNGYYNNKIDDTISSIILQIRENYNPADAHDCHKQIIKIADFKNITRVFRRQNPHPNY